MTHNGMPFGHAPDADGQADGNNRRQPLGDCCHGQRDGNHEGFAKRGVLDPDAENDQNRYHDHDGNGDPGCYPGQLPCQRCLQLRGLIEKRVDPPKFGVVPRRDNHAGGCTLNHQGSAVGHAKTVPQR